MTDPRPDLIVALGEVAETYGLRLSVGDHAAIARRLAEKDRATLTRGDVAEAFEHQGLRAPIGYAKDLLARWSTLAPPKSLLDILLDTGSARLTP